ncbi:hypothetical protein [Paenibacillus hexagrammi]|uniref:Lipoprotein n=1 Tax=Paenibacillus hexagrammi TaxID=2908839 RepID=A0ABY3SNR1_9BACL|nr:hypothetical protein [Paenibacillus sp. YPD9-1]UJF35594.1 hypothetical protein L0M14_11130 [Paenibacillus sp. YPD9-1]
MKKLIGSAAAALLVFTLTACSDVVSHQLPVSNQPSSTTAAKSQNNGKSVLFIGQEGGGDGIVIKRFKEKHGLNVTVVSDKEVTTEKANGFSLIYVSESVNSGKIKDKFVATPVPVIYDEPQISGDTGMTDPDMNGKLEGENATKTIQIRNAQHPLAAGLNNTVDVYKDNGKMSWATPGKDAIVVATLPDDEQKATIFAYDKGSQNVKGQMVPAREVFFYMMFGEEINQTDDGWKLFDAAVRWATEKK